MSIQPHGEDLRQAVKWIGAERRDNPAAPLYRLIERACVKFNLTPADAAALEEILKEKNGQK